MQHSMKPRVQEMFDMGEGESYLPIVCYVSSTTLPRGYIKMKCCDMLFAVVVMHELFQRDLCLDDNHLTLNYD